MTRDWNKWSEMVKEEKGHFAQLEKDLGDEYREVMAVLDKLRFIKNTVVVLLSHVSYLEKTGNHQTGTAAEVSDCIHDLEVALRDLQTMQSREFRLTHMLERVIQKGKSAHKRMLQIEGGFGRDLLS